LRLVTSSGEALVLRRRKLGAALLVRPRILADGNIDLDLEPFFATQQRRYNLTAMRTRVLLVPGQKLVVGANSSAREHSVASGLFGFDSSGKRSATIITVTVKPM
jgi:hypothetical protein